ncbi:fumarylacetoacetate hydrolase family protein [Actinomadura madurae]|uniref:fumarylacetoacetate hydrolase family protein n=1 Tax=Actinomadura madurae TaxID=1993 RepID=UPI0020D25713|nr:fumarylacetoacetate hydrolase family protein [Actinomadura madurae]MCP9955566.1 fumarylacetoacetate hydrolase family protein [Actinomadura madurae]MCQ0003635.1 fumarylacetoacetate hydrolase family protein [Actinomadura madurae]
MRWTAYRSPHDRTPRLGLVEGDEVLESPSQNDLLALLGDDGSRMAEAAEEARAAPAARRRLEDLHLQAPIPVPPSIRDFMAFEEHLLPILAARGARLDPAWYEIPAFYFTNPAAVLGPTDDVPCAPGAVELDFELEIAAVVGAAGRDLTPEQGTALIAGYILMCDWSARDLQRRERGIGLGPVKGKDWATSFGPLFVTPDELPLDPRGRTPDIPMTASVNGRAYSEGRLGELFWTFGQMIAYASRGTEVRPGDVIGSGTVGTGCIADLAARRSPEEYPWLEAGDVVRLDAGPLGTIQSRLVPPPAVVPLGDPLRPVKEVAR